MPTTFRTHFNDDITRAENILARSRAMQNAGEPERLCRDVRLSSIALAVGALDAYLCDAYVDCLTAVLRAYTQGQWVGALPSTYSKQMLPAGEIIADARGTQFETSLMVKQERGFATSGCSLKISTTIWIPIGLYERPRLCATFTLRFDRARFSSRPSRS